MKKTIFLAAGLLFSISTQAQTQTQIFDILKSAVKTKTGVDLGNTKSQNPTNSTSTGSTTTNSNSNINLGNLTSTQISSGLKEALNLGVKEGVQKLGVTDGFLKNEAVKILMPEKLRK